MHILIDSGSYHCGNVGDVAMLQAALEQPVTVISRISRCRITVTGSYHGAVFAPAQGISVIAIAAAQYAVLREQVLGPCSPLQRRM
jgi:polysaccharide pyruvyl transferase WcaK-like protein